MIEEHDSPYVHYVIVVHGIGEQRQNESLIPVINRFAEARQQDLNAHYKAENRRAKWKDRISLGKLTSQVGTRNYSQLDDFDSQSNHWIEMKGIPAQKPLSKQKDYFFDGEADDVKNGANIRFVDMWWADILSEHHKIAGEEIGPWTDAVVARLTELQKEYERNGHTDPNTVYIEPWLPLILEQIQETSLFAQKIASLPKVGKGELVKDILTNYVGDIQAYGENSKVRGQAVSRFHKVMENLTKQHFDDPLTKNKEPKFTIIAHSLGTVMALDAIMYGHVLKQYAFPELVQKKEGESQFSIPNIPFDAYNPGHLHLPNQISKTNKETVGENWLKHIDTLITLGSPIDKYLKLWPQNYRYLRNLRTPQANACSEKIDIFASRKDDPIKHLNYCDSQDPVGHHLNELQSRTVYDSIFSSDNKDIVYSRYIIPGVAHVKYWEDTELFRDIINNSIDSAEKKTKLENKQTAPFSSKSNLGGYWPIMILTYYLPTLFTALLMSLLFIWGWEAMRGDFDEIEGQTIISWKSAAISTFILCFSAYFLKKMIELIIWWRQLLKQLKPNNMIKNRSKFGPIFFQTYMWIGLAVLMIFTPLYIARTVKFMEQSADHWWFALWYALMIIGVGLAIYIMSRVFWRRSWPQKNSLRYLPEIATTLAALLIAFFTFILLNSDSSWVSEEPSIISKRWLPKVAIVLAALTVSWTYTAVSITAINAKIRLKSKIHHKDDKHQFQVANETIPEVEIKVRV